MTTKLLRTIRQTKPVAPRSAEALLTILFAAERLQYRQEHFLKARAGITATQYNALRIIAGAGEEGLPCKEIGSRMVRQVPDVTRLLERLERMGLVTRRRRDDNRRVVLVRATTAGLELLARLREPLAEMIDSMIGPMGAERIEQLIRLVDEATPD
jgi:DNA-binding MarR family transcriptional regulator